MASALLQRGLRHAWKFRPNVRWLASEGKPADFAEVDPSFASGQSVEVTILNQEPEGIFIDSYSCIGFRLNSGVRVMGPCAMFPKTVLHWNVKGLADVNENSLSLFTMLEPKLDLLVLGVGERDNLKRINPDIIRYLRSHKINVEILSTDQALSTYNFLNAEQRFVAGAFIPPNFMEDFYEDEEEDAQFKLLSDREGLNVYATEDMFFPDPPDPKEVEKSQEFIREQRKGVMDKIYRTEAREEDKKKNPHKYLDD